MRGKYSFSAISRRETGDLSIDLEYLNDFFAALNVTEEERANILASARIGALRPHYNKLESVSEYVNIALNATSFHMYNAGLINRYLQTLGYAKHAILAYRDFDDADNAAAARVEEAKKALANPLRQWRILCHENALYFPIGGSQVMIGQLESLLTFEDTPNVEFRLLPRTELTSLPLHEEFQILNRSFCFCENRLDYSITDDPQTVAHFQNDFDVIWSHSVIGLRRNQILQRAIEYYRSLETTPHDLGPTLQRKQA